MRTLFRIHLHIQTRAKFMPKCKICGTHYASRYKIMGGVCKPCVTGRKESKKRRVALQEAARNLRYFGAKFHDTDLTRTAIYNFTGQSFDLCGEIRKCDVWDGVERYLQTATDDRIRARLLRQYSANRARRLAAINASAEHYTKGHVLYLFDKQQAKCMACGGDIADRFHVDHIYPLARGGSNGFSNIQLLCPTCNIRKHVKDPIAFLVENGYQTHCAL